MATKRNKRSVGRPTRGATGLSADAVLDAALRRLDAEGDRGVTFRALARELGVTPMAVSHHVGSRDEMFVALVDRVFAGVGDVSVTGPPLERLRAMLERYCRRVVEHPNLVQWVFANPTSIAGPLEALTQAIRDDLAALGLEDAEQETRLGVLVDYTHGFAVSMAAYSEPEASQRDALPPQTIDDYLRGLDWLLGAVAPRPDR